MENGSIIDKFGGNRKKVRKNVRDWFKIFSKELGWKCFENVIKKDSISNYIFIDDEGFVTYDICIDLDKVTYEALEEFRKCAVNGSYRRR